MGIYRRGRIYWYRITFQRKRIQASTGTANKKLAERIYAKILTDIIEGRYFDSIKAQQITFKAMVDKFMKKYGNPRHETSLTHLLPVFGNLMLADITTEKISDYIDERLKDVMPATVYQEFALIRRMFNVARREWKWTKDNPAADISFRMGTSNARTRWLTYEEEDQLLKSVSPEWLCRMIKFALHTGMRRGEILDIKWSSINFEKRVINVERSKNREKRSIPMNKTLFNMLSKPRVVDNTNRVFPHSIAAFKDAFPRARDKAGIKDFRFHDLRHTFATRLVQNGVDLNKVKDLLGHKDLKMSMRYAHHNYESLRSSVEILDKLDNSVKIEQFDDEASLLSTEIAFKIKHGSV